MSAARAMRDPGPRGRAPGAARVVWVRQPQRDRQAHRGGPGPRLAQPPAHRVCLAGEPRRGTPEPCRVPLPHHRARGRAFLRLQAVDAQDPGGHVPRRRHHLGSLRPGREQGWLAADSLRDGSGRQWHRRGVGQCAAELRHGPMAGEAAMAHPTAHVPTDEPPRQRQGGFRVGATRLGLRGTMAVGAVGSCAPHLHRSLQRTNAVPTVIADVESPSTNRTHVVFHFQPQTCEPSVFGPAVRHRSPPWQRSAASCSGALS
jgi:hypothetical protein